MGALLALVLASPAAAETIAVTNAHILSMGRAGEIASGTVVIRDGKIVSVGPGAAAPAGARVIDAGGRIVTPGMVETNTTLAAVEVEGVDQTNDQGTGSDKLSAAYDIQYALNPDAVQIPKHRLAGVTRAIVTPEYRGSGRRNLLFSGQAAAIHLGAGMDILVKPKVGMVVELGETGATRAGGGQGASLVLLRSMLDDARAFSRNRAAFERSATRDFGLSREDLEALIPVIAGRMPLIVGVHRASDILQVLKLAREQRLRLVLEGAEEGWRVAAQIAADRVPVILNAEADLPTSFEQLNATLENAAKLNAAGVLIAIEPGRGPSYVRSPRYNAGRAVGYGLPYAAALASVTVNPARIWGLDEQFGSLEPGRDGDLVIWSGDPLELTSAPTAVFIRGVQQPLRSRDLELRDRYLPAAIAAGQAK